MDELISSKTTSNARIKVPDSIHLVSRYGVGAGIAACAFAGVSSQLGLLNKQITDKIFLAGLGVTFTSAIPSIAESLDPEKITKGVLGSMQKTLPSFQVV